MSRFVNVVALGALLSFLACSRQEQASWALFERQTAEQTGISFRNDLKPTKAYNAYTFRNFYNGAGVGIGDVNNDGLPDLYFCGNLENNKLYLNQGDFKFKDITEAAGVACTDVWSTGVSMADVNGDGWLDIYVCKSGAVSGDNRHNELFINNQDGTFTEQAKAWGIADLGLSVHAAFFDYDRDGDLDCYLLNNSMRSVGAYDYRPGQREVRDSSGGNKLYRNEGRKFVDVSEKAGIYGSAIGFGLGVAVGDVNRDGWPDLFVSNDFFERDYLYLNNQDGTFTESLVHQMPEISKGSMGADIADINNDGYPEVFVTEMLPETDARMKTKTAFDDWDRYQLSLQNGYHRQFTRNVLQLNNQDSTFSEIGRLAGLHATDWSWGALIADFDNDGLRDIFVANGIFKDLTDQDYLNFYSDPDQVRALIAQKGDEAINALIDKMPSEAVSNYLFHNKGNWKFENVAEDWGVGTPSFSNGSAYGDLDLDGDLDLVVNNVNSNAFVYRNKAVELGKYHYLQIELQGEAPNTRGLGAQVTVRAGERQWFQEMAPMRGFQSCVGQSLHFGLGDVEQVDVVVSWPDGRWSKLQKVPVDQRLRIKQSGAETLPPGLSAAEKAPESPLFEPVRLLQEEIAPHRENAFVDFDRDRLLYHMRSREGPPMTAGDANGDGLQDFYLGGAKGQAGQLLLQQADGRFRLQAEGPWLADADAEDTDALFFDADGDGDQDLYVASGGSEFSSSSFALIDRLYRNEGKGAFVKSPQLLPGGQPASTGTVEAADVDSDGDLDLFVGLRMRPFLYGVPADAYLLINDGNGTFEDASSVRAPGFKACGLVTDAVWADLNRDGATDLVVAGEWMPLKVFLNLEGRLVEQTEEWGMQSSNGLWQSVEAADLNADGYTDLVLGNHGWNTRLRASADKPLNMYVNDFDGNGSAEQILCVYNKEEPYPLALRHDLIEQLPSLKKQYLKYENYKNQTIEDIFSPEQLKGSVHLQVYRTGSAVAINVSGNSFQLQDLPVEAQFAPCYATLTEDYDQDGNADILMGGNFHHAKPEIGIYAASYGLMLRGDGAGGFQAVPARESGFFIRGEVRSFTRLPTEGGMVIGVGRNDDTPAFFNLK